MTDQKDNIKKICDVYDQKVLRPILGNGEVRERLYSGLHEVLKESIEKGLPDIPSPDVDLDSEIDFNALDFSYPKQVANALDSAGITTYRDLINYIGVGRPESLFRLRWLGKKGFRALMDHLDEMNISHRRVISP